MFVSRPNFLDYLHAAGDKLAMSRSTSSSSSSSSSSGGRDTTTADSAKFGAELFACDQIYEEVIDENETLSDK